ncbi:MAG TPA: hypothetical protein VEK38_04705 [Candidatus Bathyarchaeia archaeon]|nr:hypothetical protein [Candidatus Bathyarchaeia archaeon]
MKIIDTVQQFLDSMDTRTFYLYSAIYLATLTVLSVGIVYYHYSAMAFWRKKIVNINEAREKTRDILEQSLRVSQERAAVDAMMAEDPNFKIGGYFDHVVQQLHLTDKKDTEETAQIDREDGYRETELTARFVDMNMKLIAELLQEIEKTKRIHMKRLDIQKSKKSGNTLDMELVIATLLPKTAS